MLPTHQKPSWGQAWRFRLQPFGRLSSRTKIVQITIKGAVSGVDLGLHAQALSDARHRVTTLYAGRAEGVGISWNSVATPLGDLTRASPRFFFLAIDRLFSRRVECRSAVFVVDVFGNHRRGTLGISAGSGSFAYELHVLPYVYLLQYICLLPPSLCHLSGRRGTLGSVTEQHPAAQPSVPLPCTIYRCTNFICLRPPNIQYTAQQMSLVVWDVSGVLTHEQLCRPPDTAQPVLQKTPFSHGIKADFHSQRVLLTTRPYLCFTRQLGLTAQPQLFKEPDLTMFALVKTLKTAAHDPRIKGVLMQFEAPALSMAATMEASAVPFAFRFGVFFFWLPPPRCFSLEKPLAVLSFFGVLAWVYPGCRPPNQALVRFLAGIIARTRMRQT